MKCFIKAKMSCKTNEQTNKRTNRQKDKIMYVEIRANASVSEESVRIELQKHVEEMVDNWFDSVESWFEDADAFKGFICDARDPSDWLEHVLEETKPF